jgi:hypothetical protein
MVMRKSFVFAFSAASALTMAVFAQVQLGGSGWDPFNPSTLGTSSWTTGSRTQTFGNQAGQPEVFIRVLEVPGSIVLSARPPFIPRARSPFLPGPR